MLTTGTGCRSYTYFLHYATHMAAVSLHNGPHLQCLPRSPCPEQRGINVETSSKLQRDLLRSLELYGLTPATRSHLSFIAAPRVRRSPGRRLWQQRRGGWEHQEGVLHSPYVILVFIHELDGRNVPRVGREMFN